MSAERVFAAAVALREFSIEEIAAYCGDSPTEITDVLASAGVALEQVEPALGASQRPRWRPADPGRLRRLLQGRLLQGRLLQGRLVQDGPSPSSVTRRPPNDDHDDHDDQLRHAEESLVRCGAEASQERRRVMVSTAVNHLRQALARQLPEDPPWWELNLGDDLVERIGDRRLHHRDPAAGTRLRLGLTVARLAVGNVVGEPVPTAELIDSVVRIRYDTAQVGVDDWMEGLVRGFVELATAQLTLGTAPAVHKLVVAVARRRVAAQAESDPVAAMSALEPLVRRLSSGPAQGRVDDLYRPLAQLPEGDHAVVYADLLSLLPLELRYEQRGAPLPGGLVEIVGESAATDRLRHCASKLESDLRAGEIRSDRGLIGQAAQVFHDLADAAPVDGRMQSRGNVVRSELMELAMTPIWPAPSSPAEGVLR